MNVMKQNRMVWMMLVLTGWLIVWTEGAFAQASGELDLRIRLRASDGTAVAGETVILERLPEAEPYPACITDNHGQCAWRVGRGLYQVLFARPLDDISALAVAEGGLRGLGVTVGDSSIVYHFTFHSDGRVYFDAAPEAAVPSPIIPVGELLHGGIVPTSRPSDSEGKPAAETPTPAPTKASDATTGPTFSGPWRLLLFIGGGLVIGGGFHRWSRRRQHILNRQSSIANRQSESPDA